MTTGAELQTLLSTVQVSGLPGFDVLNVPSAPGFKIGLDAASSIVLLTPPDPAPQPPTELHRVSMDPRLTLEVRDAVGRAMRGEFGLVRLRMGENEYRAAFLNVIANLIGVIGTDPGPGDVSVAMRRLVRLFEPTMTSRTTILGLWGELLVISRSDAPADMLDAWHSRVDARFDFSAQGSRIEVKTTTRSDRRHSFSLEQLLPVAGSTTWVVSIMTTQTNSGTTLQDLIDKLETRFAEHPSRQMRVHEVVAETLGPAWASSMRTGFDATQAIESMAVLQASTIPRFRGVPDGVSDVRFVADCSAVLSGSARSGLSVHIR
ncbi:PD-(D/E)XK motif protein [Aeromicrobium massiliense]|uniref:PD-(D/E)XK motif protein n=1 Tax=Aeromicrobium massiliense TaxID=1464554 RepID=UPI000A4A5DA5|nr:PD-(D/E)XK motif protein [Aeromicrobium massiliense]